MSTSNDSHKNPQQQGKDPFPLRVRIVQIFFVIVGVILTLLLAWWQYDRWQATDGTFQNLGYAIQWPLFGIFLVVSYRQYIKYERQRLLGDDEAAVKKTEDHELTEVPEDFLSAASRPDQRSTTAEDIFADNRRRNSRSAPLPNEHKRAAQKHTTNNDQ